MSKSKTAFVAVVALIFGWLLGVWYSSAFIAKQHQNGNIAFNKHPRQWN